MTGRRVRLHVRRCGADRALLGAFALVLVGWGAATWLLSRSDPLEGIARLPVIVLLPLAVTLVLGAALDGGADDLLRTTPTNWRWLRVAETAASTVLVSATALIATVAPTDYGALALVRNAWGAVGLLLLGASALGLVLSWAPPLVYFTSVYVAAGDRLELDAEGAALWWTWPVQPSGSAPSWTSAVVLLLLGMAAYIGLGTAGQRSVRPLVARIEVRVARVGARHPGRGDRADGRPQAPGSP